MWFVFMVEKWKINKINSLLIRVYGPVLHAKTGNTVMALLIPLIQRWDPNPICLRWIVCSALDNNVFHFNPNNNTLTKKHEILSPGYYHFIHYFVVSFFKTSRNKSRQLSA